MCLLWRKSVRSGNDARAISRQSPIVMLMYIIYWPEYRSHFATNATLKALSHEAIFSCNLQRKFGWKRHMQVVVWLAVGLFCKLEVLQEAISLVKGSLKRRCVASCKKTLPRVTAPLRVPTNHGQEFVPRTNNCKHYKVNRRKTPAVLKALGPVHMSPASRDTHLSEIHDSIWKTISTSYGQRASPVRWDPALG